MERDDVDNDRVLLNDSDERLRSALNSTVLDYYRKFGRKRDLEQYFSLSTAQSDIRDPSSLFWRRMKEQSDTSDSGEKKSESSNEICRISIKCSIPEGHHSQRDDSHSKTDSESPPIITDAVPGPSHSLTHSGDESVDDNHSQKSMDETMDNSMNKPLSPTSSVTSQRKLEWDSLADVGYGNESDRKTSASSLSTLEREVLAQKQQYTLDFKQNSDVGLPTAQSTPMDPTDSKAKGKKGQGKKTMTFCNKDVDFVEVRVPHNVENTQAISVNLTKQFSVNLEKDGCFTVDNVKKEFTVSPEKGSVNTEADPYVKIDKEIQTSLLRSEKKVQNPVRPSVKKVPVLICFNTLRRRHRRHKRRILKAKVNNKRKLNDKNNTQQEKEKSVEQVSEAESFEYMPGHMYNQNQLNENPIVQSNNIAGNKSSLESSVAHTTDSSKESKYSFTKDLEKSLDVLKSALKDKYDSNLKKKLVKDIIQRLLKSKYGDDDSTPDFLSVLSLSSKKTPTTSTSDGDNTRDKELRAKPKKSILRVNKFNSNDIASTSQSAPNLPSAVNNEKPILPYLPKQVSSTNTDTDLSANNSIKDNTSSDTVFAKTSSEELYKKYIDALKKEEAYKLHLKDKEMFLRQKLVRSDTALKVPARLDIKTNNKLKELIKDLTRNNYDDGSGDASKLEGGSSSNFDFNRPRVVRKQRSHSVFTLSSGNSDANNLKFNFKDKEQQENAASKAGPSHHREHRSYSNKKHSYDKTNVTDSSVQVNMIIPNEYKQNQHTELQVSSTPKITEDVRYVCLCTEKGVDSQSSPDEFLIYKCSRLTGQMPVINTSSQACNTANIPCSSKSTTLKGNIMMQTHSPREDESKAKSCLKESSACDDIPLSRKVSKSSQTNVKLNLNTLQQPLSTRSTGSSSTEDGIRRENMYCGFSKNKSDSSRNNNDINCFNKPRSNYNSKFIQESTRCLQTEISIHPKISDPTLSDINIINSKECVQLISELYRKVSRSSSEHNDSTEKDNTKTDTVCSKSSKDYKPDDVKYNSDHPSDDDKITLLQKQPKDENIPQTCGSCQPAPAEDRGIPQTYIGHQTLPTKQSETISENIVIPIQGTNMTLKVSIAGPEKPEHSPQTKIPNVTESHGMTTDNIENFEKYTCISAECSKGVQSRNPNDASKNTISGLCCGPKPDSDKDEVSESYQPVEARSNTYPKVIQNKNSKPLLRSNTDTGGLGACCANQTDAIQNHDNETEPIESKPVCASRRQSKPENNSKIQTQHCEESADHSTSENLKYSSGKQRDSDEKFEGSKSKMCCNMVNNEGTSKDLILDMIQDITKRYSKKDIEKSNKKKCFQEIMTVINYLLDTDDSGDGEQDLAKDSTGSIEGKRSNKKNKDSAKSCCNEDTEINKATAKCRSSPRKISIDTFNLKSVNNTNKLYQKSERSETTEKKTTKDTCCVGGKISTKTIPDHGDTKIERPIDLTTNPSSNSDSYKYERKGTSRQSSTSESMKHSERSDSSKYKTDTKILQRNDNLHKTQDRGCGRDDSSGCKESSDRDHESYDKQEEMSEKSETQANLPTCDKGCGCDESSECKETSQWDLKEKTDKAHKRSLWSKKQSMGKCAPKTCDKSCGCNESSECTETCDNPAKTEKQTTQSSSKKLVSKCVQSNPRKVKSVCSQHIDSSDIVISTDQPSCSTSSPTARIINKIKKECEKYQKRSKYHSCKKNEPSSSTSMNCDHCMRPPPCHCKGSKCRGHRTKTTMEKIKKKCMAYNLILQTSDSMISDENVFGKHCQKLQNVVIKVPKRRQENIPFKEMSAKIERNMPYCSPRCHPKNRSRSWPNESGISSTDDVKMAQAYTVRDYLERNRPDFVERCAHRQNCIRMISESRPEASPCCRPMKMIVIHNPNCNTGCTGPTTMFCGGVPMNYNCTNPCVQTVENEVTRVASERSQQREVLSTQLENLPTLTEDEIRYLAKELGFGRRPPVHSKIISEREMKKHSEKIYKSLPEVVQKKEEAKKESIKRTNLLMANIFKKNLQKKTLRGAVNLSNYSAVIKI